MKRKLKQISITIIIIVSAVLIWNIVFKQGQDYAESLIGSLFGTLIGAATVFFYQVRMERVRYFQSFFERGQEIMADKTAWKLIKNKWINVEFRNAVGLAEWDNDPSDHKKYFTENFKDCDGLIWHGIAYRIDNNYCVASKALHEYAAWYQNLMEAYHVNLLKDYHIKMMWRNLVDASYPTGNFLQRNQPCMRKWLEQFILGSVVYEKNDFKEIKKQYRKYSKIRNIVEKYKPVSVYFTTKSLECEEENIKESKGM